MVKADGRRTERQSHGLNTIRPTTGGLLMVKENSKSVYEANKFYEFQKYLSTRWSVYGTDFSC